VELYYLDSVFYWFLTVVMNYGIYNVKNINDYVLNCR
jgi:hypothetical protein